MVNIWYVNVAKYTTMGMELEGVGELLRLGGGGIYSVQFYYVVAVLLLGDGIVCAV